MNLDDKVKALKEHQKKLKAYNHASSLLFYDAATAMPPGAAELSGAELPVLALPPHPASIPAPRARASTAEISFFIGLPPVLSLYLLPGAFWAAR